jgi:lipopolysaccharide transport system permease protein
LTATLRYARQFFDLPGLACNLGRHQELTGTMTWRGFTACCQGTFGGLFWSVILPVVMMVIYTVVFSLFLKVKFTTDASPLTFSVYLLCGLLPWQEVSEGLSRSTGVICSNVNLVKRVVFPLEILPVNLALIAAIQQVVGFALLVPLAWWVTGGLHETLLFVPVILALQLLFTTGLNWIAASLSVYLPNLRLFISLLLILWMFLTLTFYPEDVVPSQALIIFRLNPTARLVTLYRGAFMKGLLPSLDGLVGAVGLCLLVFLLGYFWFMHTKRGFADVL